MSTKRPQARRQAARSCAGSPRLYVSTEAREGETDAQWRARTDQDLKRGAIGFTHPMGSRQITRSQSKPPRPEPGNAATEGQKGQP